MNWIEEIRHDIASLKATPSVLKKFGMVLGCVVVGISLYATWQEWFTDLTNGIVCVVGLGLALTGFVRPVLLSGLHKYWMGIAFVLGSIVSRVILTIIFFVIITPISLAARLTGKRFFFTFRNISKDTYWIDRDKKKSINYERMS